MGLFQCRLREPHLGFFGVFGLQGPNNLSFSNGIAQVNRHLLPEIKHASFRVLVRSCHGQYHGWCITPVYIRSPINLLIQHIFLILHRKLWCCERGLNSRPHPYQGCALPLSYHSAGAVWACALPAWRLIRRYLVAMQGVSGLGNLDPSGCIG